MNQFKSKKYLSRIVLLSGFFITLAIVSELSGAATSIAQKPLFVATAVPPKVMLNMSKDHQLFFKAFDDYSDLDNDGTPETTYNHSFDYYGYFDSYKCYSYSNNRFEPSSTTSTKYCTGLWSGNFLNWATMARIDTIRKILYGGLRSVDSTGETVLERAYIPTDAHSWAKFYKDVDLNQLTPYNHTDGLTVCNTTEAASGFSQNVTAPPLIRVAKGDFSLWAGNDGWQCRWQENMGTWGNGNIPASTGMNASSISPSKFSSGSAEYIARVKVCVNDTLKGQENCKKYAGNLKPIGLLQEFGDDNTIAFGLMTGSFQKNKDGGVLRKNISAFSDEINADGTFATAPATGGIINTINKLRIVGYDHSIGQYNVADTCPWLISSFVNSNCRNWGNPQAEILLESLRYLAGKSATPSYSANDTTVIPGLTTASFVDPIKPAESCASLNVIQFNASTTSFDADGLGLATDIGLTNLNAATDAVGALEGAGNYFYGEASGGSGTDINQLCTAKAITNSGAKGLSKVLGTCPDAPRLSGSYQIAGLANYAHTNDLRSDIANKQSVTLYGIALSPAVPKVVVAVPGSTTKKITILPACRNITNTAAHPTPTNCAIVDFKIVSQTANATTATGRLYVNWEDSEQGGDYDKDQWGIINYEITSSTAKITTDVFTSIGSGKLGFGYVINGTTQDGFHVHSGINSFAFTDSTGLTCTNCIVADPASTRTYNIGTSTAKSLEQPLFYAAKWGGFIDADNSLTPNSVSEWDAINNVTGAALSDGIPDKYFAATNPQVLASSLAKALETITLGEGSASAVAANSGSLDTGTLIYQAKFDATDWSGDLLALDIDDTTGAVDTATPNWRASAQLPAHGSRTIYTYKPTAAAGARGILFQWPNLTKATDTPTPPPPTQQTYLNTLNGVVDTTKGTLRLDWLRGDSTNEKISDADTNPAHIFRKRTNVLGDIINSDPVYVGSEDYGYSALSDYSAFVTTKTSRTPMLYVGGNDGMLHGFDARKNGSGSPVVTTGGKEVFAYIPNALFPELSKLTSPSYTHQYYVDGVSAAGDVYDGTWHTLLAGTTGAGGRAIFALDVTNPAAFGAASALWEFTNTNKSDGTPNPDGGDLGYTLAQPSVVRMQDGSWAVIVANGYNSDNGKAVLFVLNALTGAVLQKIDTGVGPTTLPGRPDKNGLSTPIAVDTNNDRGVDTVYAGDLYGNLWKFDVSGTAGSWPIPASPLFVACTTTGTCLDVNRQPITSKPNVGKVGAAGTDQNGVGIMVYFGTGKYFETGDNSVGPSPQVQSFYGLWDNGAVITDRANLQEQTIDFEGAPVNATGTAATGIVRVMSRKTVCYSATTVALADDDTPVITCSSSNLKKGWAMDLLKPVNIAQGERVVSPPVLYQGLVIFSTLIPNTDPCEPGGESRVMLVEALTGKRPATSAFDIFGGTSLAPTTSSDGKVDGADLVKVNGKLVAASGLSLDIGIHGSISIIGNHGYASGSGGDGVGPGSIAAVGTPGSAHLGHFTLPPPPPPCTTCPPGSGKRVSWRQLR